MQTAGHMAKSAGFRRDNPVVAGLFLMGFAVIVGAIALIASSGSVDAYPFLFLLPWIFGLAVVMAIPMVILHYRGKFTFVDPLVFATLTSFFPAYVLGGFFFAVGLSQPTFLALIQDPFYTLPLTVVLVALGYSGLAAGYLLPVGAWLGKKAAKRLPLADYAPSSLVVPAVLLLLSGVLNSYFALIIGRFGYQKAAEINSYDGIVYLTTLFWVQGSFLLWLVIFREKTWKVIFVPLIVLLATTSLTKFLFSGSRGSILQAFWIISFSYILAGRKISLKQGAISGVLLTAAILVGVIYATTFRNVKGSEDTQSAEMYADNIFRTFDEVGRSDTFETLSFGVSTFTGRIDILSTLAVVVSNHEQLKPYEEAYGLDDNIWTDTTTFLIPRVVWEDKPIASDPRKYSDLYFNYGGSSYAITPIGDLLRNYGIIGVPLGMFLIGVILRFIFRSLVEGQSLVIWRRTIYFMLVTMVSYEGFYGTIIPTFFKVGFTAIVAMLLVNLIASQIDKGKLTV